MESKPLTMYRVIVKEQRTSIESQRRTLYRFTPLEAIDGAIRWTRLLNHSMAPEDARYRYWRIVQQSRVVYPKLIAEGTNESTVEDYRASFPETQA